MFFPVFLLGLALHSGPAISIRCGNNLDAHTVPERSLAGFIVSLVFHSEDDHDPNTHNCAANFYIKVRKPDGSAEDTENLTNSESDWRRPITFRVDGFSPDGNLAYVFISDGGRYATVNAIEYDMRTGKQRALYLQSAKAWGATAACAASIHILGIGTTGHLVFSTSATGRCTRRELWDTAFDQDPNEVIQPKTPAHLTSDRSITKLSPGKAAAR
ncbi:MAG: hypothetical protein WAL75_11040 [Terracidiphilus sp.]